MAAAVGAAAERLRGRVVATPLVASPWLSAATGAEVRLKLENVQRTGSFKWRGALHALLALPPEARQRGVVAASSGNHGLAVATAAATLGVPARVFVPLAADPAKVEAIAAAGASVERHGDDCVHTEAHARATAAATGRRYVSPYNDPDVVAGQGTVACELLAEWPDVEVVYVALGGGGLLGGMAAYAKVDHPRVEFVAASPQQSAAMAECVRQGRIVEVPCGPTLSDSTAGGVEPDAITFPLCQRLVDRFVDVDEPAIASAWRAMLAREHLLVEGAAAVAVAACRQDAALAGRRAAVVVCGANMPLAVVRRLLAADG
ncbi:MAG: threonine/serine dehydratase [Planctomycetes bacterium]|nr:threonine/serine dehydratase [Planctomycetota bacterium]